MPGSEERFGSISQSLASWLMVNGLSGANLGRSTPEVASAGHRPAGQSGSLQ
jgi:hypothetical protein